MNQDDKVRLAWHDATCPESYDCRDRLLHALAAPIALLVRYEEMKERL